MPQFGSGVLIHSHSWVRPSSWHLRGPCWSVFPDTETLPISGSVAIAISTELPTRPWAGSFLGRCPRRCSSSTQQPSRTARTAPQPGRELRGRLLPPRGSRPGPGVGDPPPHGAHVLCDVLLLPGGTAGCPGRRPCRHAARTWGCPGSSMVHSQGELLPELWETQA